VSRDGTWGIRSALIGGISDSDMEGSPRLSWRRYRHGGRVYNPGKTSLRLSSRLVGSYTGGGVNKGIPVRTPPTEAAGEIDHPRRSQAR
jgi:hypothetical protein